jgi:hypothetical protein
MDHLHGGMVVAALFAIHSRQLEPWSNVIPRMRGGNEDEKQI